MRNLTQPPGGAIYIYIYMYIFYQLDVKKTRKCNIPSAETYLSSFGMYLFGMWSSSKIVVSSEPLAQRNRA